MKRTYKYITLAALALGFAACTQDDDFAPQQEDIVKIASANIATEVQTRVNTLADGTQWENTDQILLVNNSRDSKNSGTYTYNDNAWNLTNGIVLYASCTNSFTAYYPASEDFTLPTDQSDEAKIKSSDRMVATVDGVARGEAVALSFVRENAMVTITPYINTVFGDNATISSLQIAGITPYHTENATDYKAIIVPTTTGFEVTVKVKVGEIEQTLTANTATVIEAGKHYSFNLTVGRAVVGIQAVSVTPWVEKGIDGGVAEELHYEYDDVSNTYTVYTTEGLLAWNEAVLDDASTNLVLAADIILPATTADGTSITLTDNVPSGGNWTTIGTAEDNSFVGTIDGGGHTITGLRLNNNSEYQGFIGFIGQGGTVKNLTFADAFVSLGKYSGIVVGINYGTVENCHIQSGSSITGNDKQCGGIAGANANMIIGCTNSATVTMTDVSSGIYVGGIVGHNASGSVLGCFNHGAVKGYSSVGGIIGTNQKGNVVACGNTAQIEGTQTAELLYVGGILGMNDYNHTDSQAIGSWTVQTNETEDENANNGIGIWSSTSEEPETCYSFANASEVTSETITKMNAAIIAYNETATVKCPYTWQAVTDGYPTLVKSE